jgi:hypothetical protein
VREQENVHRVDNARNQDVRPPLLQLVRVFGEAVSSLHGLYGRCHAEGQRRDNADSKHHHSIVSFYRSCGKIPPGMSKGRQQYQF